MDSAIVATNLTKTFDRPGGWRRRTNEPAKTAVSEVNLSIPEGELFGLLGPNGAGKTTLVKMLCTLILPTSGSAVVGGFSLKESVNIRQIAGLVVSDERSFYWRLSGWQNLAFFASMVGLSGDESTKRIRQVLTHVDLTAEAGNPFRTYSSGMRQRLAIARSLLHRPQILFLDEPSRSLDPTATSRLHALIRELTGQEQMTVFLITHDLAEAENLCQRVAVMHKGRIQVVGPPAELRRNLRTLTQYVLHIDRLSSPAEQELERLVTGLHVHPKEDHLQLGFSVSDADGSLTAVLDCLRQHQTTIFSVNSLSPTLEQVFAHYTEEVS